MRKSGRAPSPRDSVQQDGDRVGARLPAGKHADSVRRLPRTDAPGRAAVLGQGNEGGAGSGSVGPLEAAPLERPEPQLHSPKTDGKPIAVLRAMLTVQQKRLDRAMKLEEERGIVFPETTVIGKDLQKLAAQIQKLEGGRVDPAPAASAPGSALPGRSRAAVALERSCASQVDIAARLGVSQPAVAQWTSGATVPREDHQAKLAEWYGIRVEWWAEPEPVAALAAPVPVDSVDDPELGDGPNAARDAAAAMVRRLRGYRVEASARNDVAAVVKLSELERRALADFARVNGELSTSDEARLLKSPRWSAIRAALVRVLTPFPDAARAVADELERMEAS